MVTVQLQAQRELIILLLFSNVSTIAEDSLTYLRTPTPEETLQAPALGILCLTAVNYVDSLESLIKKKLHYALGQGNHFIPYLTLLSFGLLVWGIAKSFSHPAGRTKSRTGLGKPMNTLV